MHSGGRGSRRCGEVEQGEQSISVPLTLLQKAIERLSLESRRHKSARAREARFHLASRGTKLPAGDKGNLPLAWWIACRVSSSPDRSVAVPRRPRLTPAQAGVGGGASVWRGAST